MEATDEVYQILSDAKALARRYYRLTGKPLGVTGEVAEYEAARILNLELELARETPNKSPSMLKYSLTT
ncbi:MULTISPECIES: hypothetical protein [unclassified Pseudomonas]|uniref:hypothetical protein n=1 Tax=unclassified Pseudomonas TaxID=196821 RepID=UPI0018666710|nr:MULTISPECIES: hypothetical protein [unclassified Pseudomonas]